MKAAHSGPPAMPGDKVRVKNKDTGWKFAGTVTAVRVDVAVVDVTAGGLLGAAPPDVHRTSAPGRSRIVIEIEVELP